MRDGADDEARYEDGEDRRRGCREWVGTGGNMPIDPMRRPPVRPSTSRIVITSTNVLDYDSLIQYERDRKLN